VIKQLTEQSEIFAAHAKLSINQMHEITEG